MVEERMRLKAAWHATFMESSRAGGAFHRARQQVEGEAQRLAIRLPANSSLQGSWPWVPAWCCAVFAALPFTALSSLASLLLLLLVFDLRGLHPLCGVVVPHVPLLATTLALMFRPVTFGRQPSLPPLLP